MLITGNNRLARTLHRSYDAAQQAAGNQVWNTPKILPLDVWLSTLWRDELSLLPSEERPLALLSASQEAVVWEHVLDRWCERNDRYLLQISAAARSARQAWALLHEWRLPRPQPVQHPGEDVAAFIDWVGAFEAECDARGWLDRARLPGRILTAIEQGKLRLPLRIYFAGFEEFTPQQNALLQVLREAGVSVELLDETTARPAAQPGRLCTLDAEDEIRRCALWLRAHLESNPAKRLGVLVPDLAERRSQIERIFADVLDPASILPGAAPQRHFDFSLGLPLSDYPMITAALTALELLRGELPLNDLSQLLRSSYLGEGHSEAQPRALLDAELRKIGDLSVRLPWLLQVGGESAEGKLHRCPKLVARCEQLQRSLGRMPRSAGPMQWAEIFAKALKLLGWPGEYGLDSSEYQTQLKWQALLEDFAALQSVKLRMSLGEALGMLNRLAGETLFQPESVAAPIQIMGLFEALGAEFDALWIMDLTGDRLPAAPEPHPLLPIALQREYGLPHASADRELKFSQRLLSRLMAAAPEVVLSYPQNEGDRKLTPSPLLAAFAAAKPDLDEGFVAYAARIHAATALEEIADSQAPPLPPEQRAFGGTGVLQSQAVCPFQAFGRYRLRAETLEEPEPGVDARLRGGLMHRALELLWAELKDLETLEALAADALRHRVEDAVRQAVEQEAARKPLTFTPRHKQIEARSLARTLLRWLEHERERSPFKVIARERELEDSRIGPLTLRRLVVDRIDELTDGRRVIIDYKTGQAHRNEWLGSRPEAPQLPLYASLENKDLAGVLFAQVRPRDSGWAGVVKDADIVEGIAAFPAGRDADKYVDWDDLLSSWKTELEALATGFTEGEARVDPKDYPKTCRWCDLGALCRVAELNERAGRWAQSEGADGDD